MKIANSIASSDFSKKLEAGLDLAYQRLVEKKAKEGGSLIYMIDGKITEVPATELLKDLRKAS